MCTAQLYELCGDDAINNRERRRGPALLPGKLAFVTSNPVQQQQASSRKARGKEGAMMYEVVFVRFAAIVVSAIDSLSFIVS